MRFVAIDLETTGLNLENDTIIEVAAIAFSLEKDTSGVFHVTSKDERSMLVNPGRKLTEEVTMITGISGEMLEGKPKWEEIQGRISDFVGRDAIIIGHNVLFDIGMLAAHNINLVDHIAIDTFELSEIFSQESESLNLGFLAGLYELSAGEMEHRALGDTRLSVALFLKYINGVSGLDEKEKSILRLLGKKEEKENISFFNKITGITDGEVYIPEYENSDQNLTTRTPLSSEKKESLFSLNDNIHDEIRLIKEQLKTQDKLALLVPNRKVQSFFCNLLDKNECPTEKGIEHFRWCSIEEISFMIHEIEHWDRKMTILMGKLLFWLKNTKTGLLEELKFYGEEREHLRFFRTRENEFHRFRNDYLKKNEGASCIIYCASEFLADPPNQFFPTIVIKDIPLLEDLIRRSTSKSIHIEHIVKDLRNFPGTENLIHSLYLLADLYENIPDRPKGELPFPPGNFGETYFFHQKKLWESSGKWLVIFSILLKDHYQKWKSERILMSRRDEIRAEYIDGSLEVLVSYGMIKQENIGVIIHIHEDGTNIMLIPHNVSSRIRDIFSRLHTDSIIAYGYNLGGKLMQRFIKNECGIQIFPEAYQKDIPKKQNLSLRKIDQKIVPGTVILTTSQKHIREIGKMLEKSGNTIFMQGISGGKEKIVSLFEKKKETAIIIGLIDTWKDESKLWAIADDIIIAKLPFDPPSDPYFLARTVGMSDNFSHYSEPMVIIRINTLIGRIRSAGYQGKISCWDDRLDTTIWGKEVAMEIL